MRSKAGVGRHSRRHQDLSPAGQQVAGTPPVEVPEGARSGIHYAHRVERVPNPQPQVHRFDPRQELLDPYARALAGGDAWGNPLSGRRSPRHGLVVHDAFDWGDDEPHRFRPNKAITYELHVRGFTQHPSSGVSRPGTFAGLVEKIPDLKALGVNVVELMPVWAFEEADSDRVDPFTGERLLNYWGYHPIAFLSPQRPVLFPKERWRGGQACGLRRLAASVSAPGHPPGASG
jgi:isoamylase